MNSKPHIDAAIDPGLTFQQIADRISGGFQDVVPALSWGETSFFYNPRQRFQRGTYFCTLKDHDGPNDRASDLDRLGVYRLNFGVPVPTFIMLFGALPARPSKGKVVEGCWDFTALDVLTPHPVYGWMGWISVLNPSQATFDRMLPLLSQAYDKARKAFEKRQRKTPK